MDDNLLLGVWRCMVPVPRPIWRRQVAGTAHQADARLGFMSPAHHRVRNFVVRELPRLGEPMSPEFIAQALHLPDDQVRAILDELERHMTFIFRNAQGAVVWAYPVTAAATPHHLTFSTGERINAA